MKHIVLEVVGLSRGSFAHGLRTSLRRHPNILHVGTDLISETVTIGYDEEVLSVADLRQWIEKCRHHCRGEVVRAHVCAPGPVPVRTPATRLDGAPTRENREAAPTSTVNGPHGQREGQ